MTEKYTQPKSRVGLWFLLLLIGAAMAALLILPREGESPRQFVERVWQEARGVTAAERQHYLVASTGARLSVETTEPVGGFWTVEFVPPPSGVVDDVRIELGGVSSWFVTDPALALIAKGKAPANPGGETGAKK